MAAQAGGCVVLCMVVHLADTEPDMIRVQKQQRQRDLWTCICQGDRGTTPDAC